MDKEKRYANVQFRVFGTLRKNLIKLETDTGQPKAAIARQALIYYFRERHGMK